MSACTVLRVVARAAAQAALMRLYWESIRIGVLLHSASGPRRDFRQIARAVIGMGRHVMLHFDPPVLVSERDGQGWEA